MKIIICGKGGSGKSTVTALIAGALQECGFKVLVIDADESNQALHRMMGINRPVPVMESLGGKKGFKEKASATFPPAHDFFPFKDNVKLDEIPEECVAGKNGIRLVVIGKIHHPGEGCACPMGSLSKMILSKLYIEKNEVIVIDTAAGIEHFGRGIDSVCDMVIDVVDPTFESFELGKKVTAMAEKSGLQIFYILNKMDENISEYIKKKFDRNKVVATIYNNRSIFTANLKGKKLTDGFKEMDTVGRLIKNLIN